jgi:hypothetical protein
LTEAAANLLKVAEDGSNVHEFTDEKIRVMLSVFGQSHRG